MVFSNLVFIFIFLPLVLFTYFLIRKDFRNYLLLAFSLVFYAWGEPKYIVLMLFSILINYGYGIWIEESHSNIKKKKWIMTFAIIVNIGLLGYFKYAIFLVHIVNSLFNTNIKLEPIPLPIGISFYTFHALSYLIDVYRRKEQAQRNLFDLSLYISFFPQLVAGPIIRYNSVAEQLTHRIVDIDKFSSGVRLFIVGLSKKVLIANQVGFLADAIFNKPTTDLSVSLSWIGIISYTLQIYFDFSGYSDMAIGLGRMFGFEFQKNFNYPYISKSITEFWRRWHISLGTWFRDYVYIPLGGNRVSKIKQYRNLFVVWGLTGFWHGASWTFIAWGLYYGVIIAIERAWLNKILPKLWSPIQHIYAILIFVIGWVFFRADNFTYSFTFIKTMFGLSGQPLYDKLSILYLHDYWLVFVIAILGSTPIAPFLLGKINKVASSLLQYSKQLVISGVLLLLLVINIVHMVNSTFNPFIYFRF